MLCAFSCMNVCIMFTSFVFFELDTLRRYHSQIFSSRNDKRHVSAYNCRLRKISVYFIAVQSFEWFCGFPRCAFWYFYKDSRRLSENVKEFGRKRKGVLPETQLRFTSNARAFDSKRKGVFGGFWKGCGRGKTWRVVGVGRHFYKLYIRGGWNKS